MRTKLLFLAVLLCSVTVLMAQDDHIADGLSSVASIAGETNTAVDSVTSPPLPEQKPLWKQKLY